MALYSKAVVEGPGGAPGISLDPELAADLKPGASLDAISYGPDGLLLLRPGASLNGYYAGSLVSVSLAEVFSHVVAGIRTGRLVVGFGATRKTISFRNGQVTFATSTEPHERLGSALVRLRVLTPAELEDALKEVRPGLRLGQVLTQRGQLKQASLYGAMTYLVREITVDLFQMASGEFLFLEGAQGPEDMLRLPERTRDLVLEGIRRGDETALLRRRFRPELRVRRGNSEAPPERAAVLSLLEAGPRELGALRSGFEGSDHAFLSWVDEALKSGELEEVTQSRIPVPRPPRPEARTTLQLYGQLIETIATALIVAGRDLSPLRSFLEEPQPGMEEAFAGVTLSDEGELDVERVSQNLESLGPVIGRARTYEALNAFASYALFAAKNQLPPDLAASLDQQMIEFMEQVTT